MSIKFQCTESVRRRYSLIMFESMWVKIMQAKSTDCWLNVIFSNASLIIIITHLSIKLLQVKARLQKMGALTSMNIFLRQEIDRMQRVITAVRNTLVDLKLAIDGTIIMSENLKDALDNIYDARVPALWKKVFFLFPLQFCLIWTMDDVWLFCFVFMFVCLVSIWSIFKILEFLSLGALVPKTLTFRKRLRAKSLMWKINLFIKRHFSHVNLYTHPRLRQRH